MNLHTTTREERLAQMRLRAKREEQQVKRWGCLLVVGIILANLVLLAAAVGIVAVGLKWALS